MAKNDDLCELCRRRKWVIAGEAGLVCDECNREYHREKAFDKIMKKHSDSRRRFKLSSARDGVWKI